MSRLAHSWNFCRNRKYADAIFTSHDRSTQTEIMTARRCPCHYTPTLLPLPPFSPPSCFHHLVWNFLNDLADSRVSEWLALFDITGPQLKAPLKPLGHHDTMAHEGLKIAIKLSPIMPRGCSLSENFLSGGGCGFLMQYQEKSSQAKCAQFVSFFCFFKLKQLRSY